MGAIVEVSTQPIPAAPRADVTAYRKGWVDGCDDHQILTELYPEIMAMVDWLHGVENEQFRAVMLVALFDDSPETTIHTSSDISITTADADILSKWRNSEDKVCIWENVFALCLREHVYVHRLYEVDGEKYLVGFLLPRDEHTRMAVLDIQSRYITHKWR